ncbi:hypothetical protein [Francisella sp. SYW-2]|uniref:hypothetical protein n=1 Tax=Francisella sp. SYW-2 TaxID=2610886 RepID=UPI00123C952E|nr:hypothetical protein [Francisella sp. SYW-2]
MQLKKELNYLSVVSVLDSNSTVEQLENFTEIIINYCEQKFSKFEFVFVDNEAPTSVVKTINSRFNNTVYNTNIISLPYSQNKEVAALAGVEASIGDYVLQFEDLIMDYSTKDLDKIYDACLVGYDVVFLKSEERESFFEKKFYKLLTKHSNKNSVLYKTRVNIISRRAINRINNMNKFIHYRKYVYCNSGLKYKFINYEANKNTLQSSLSLEKIDFATDLFIIFTNVAKKIATGISIFFILLSLLSVSYTIIAYFIINTVSGWLTMMLLVSTCFTGVFILLTIIIKYLDLILKSNQKREATFSSKRRI